jgi:hypothetical protein
VEFDFGFSACLITEKERINIEKKTRYSSCLPGDWGGLGLRCDRCLLYDVSLDFDT